MEIPVYPQRVRPPSFRKPVSTAKAEGKLAEARKYQEKARTLSFIGDITQGVLNVANRILQTQEAVEVMNAETEVAKRFDELLLSFQNPEDPVHWSEYGEKWKEVRESTKADVMEGMKLPGSKKEFERRYERMANERETQLQFDVYKQQASEMRADFDRDYNYWVEKGNFNKVKEYIAGADAGDLLIPGEADELLNKAKRDIAYSQTFQKAMTYRTIEEARKYIFSEDVPEGLLYDDRKSIFEDLKSYHESIQAEQVQELERVRTQMQGEILQKYAVGNVKELRQLRAQVLALKILPPVGTHSQKWWVDEIDTKIKTYLDATSKGETDPNTQFDPEIYAKMLRVIYDDSINLADKKEIIMSNMGADSKGNPRLRAKEDIPTLLKLAEAEKSFTAKMAFKSFDLALANGIITPMQYIDIATEFHEAEQSGKFTEDVLKQIAKNALIKLSEEYLKEELDKNILLFGKRKTKKYIEEYPPEERLIKEKSIQTGLAKEFEDFFNKKPVDTYIDEYGREAIFDGENWYMKIDGVWHKSNPETNTYEPYKRKR